MPQLADIVVKKNDGTTNITYVGLVPSAGSDIPAVFKATSVGSAPAHQPELRVLARDADGGKKRAVRGTFVYPQIATNTTTGVTSVIDAALADVNFKFPKSMSQADLNEAAAQFGNLCSAALVQAVMKSGYAPT